MTLLKRIDNADILTHDVGQLVRFYNGVLGLPLFFPYNPEEEWAAIDAGNVTIYVFKTELGEHAPRRIPSHSKSMTSTLRWPSSKGRSSGSRPARSSGATRPARGTGIDRSSIRTATCYISPNPTRLGSPDDASDSAPERDAGGA